MPTSILCRFPDRAAEACRRARAIKRELAKPAGTANYNAIIENAEWLADWLLTEPNGKLILSFAS